MAKTDVVRDSDHGSRFDVGKTGINSGGRAQVGVRYESQTLGWRPSCKHSVPTKPGIVLDPFCGSGTTGVVAFQMGRRFICMDLAYQNLQRERIPPMAFAGMWNG
jgi:hypothetical protein